ncbi:MAG TPA: hypothetical protein VH092_10370, partial [Urbifossiella sp.]|nr:hypothetical protein [Urbifossiella sp.]
MTTEHTLGLTPAAEARFDDYLDQVRRALAGAPDVSPGEIEADIREHVENELRAAARPVEPFVLEAVLRRLGPPTQWLPAGRPAAPAAPFTTLGQYLKVRWRAARAAVWRGPEDWRLAYLSFGTFALGVLAFPVFPLFLVLSYLLSRAGLAVAADRGVVLDAGRKWLLYPPVVLVSLGLGLVVAAAPLGIVAVTVEQTRQADHQERWELAGRPTANPWRNAPRLAPRALAERFPDVVTRLDRVLGVFPGPAATREVLAVGFLAAGVMAAWWAVVGCAAGAFPGLARGLVLP